MAIVIAFQMAAVLVLTHPSTHVLARGIEYEYDDRGDLAFRHQVDTALAKVRSLLDSAKSPRFILSASDVEHQYQDKFSLAEFITNTAIAATSNALDRLGVGPSVLQKLKADSDSNHVKLRFSSNETCSLIEKKVVEIADSVKHETYETTATGDPQKVEEKKITTRAVREVTEYHWSYNVSYGLLLVHDDVDLDDAVIQSRKGTEIIVVTGSERAPCPPQHVHPHRDVDLNWYLQQLHTSGEGFQSQFSIDRDASSCKTPRRNDDVQKAVEAFEELRQWTWRVSSFFHDTVPSRLRSQYHHQSREYGSSFSVDDSIIFVPVLPLFQHDINGSSSESSDPLLSSADVNVLLTEQLRTIDSTISTLSEKFPSEDDGSIASTAEARLVLLMKHVASISSSFVQGVNHVEGMLRSQLVSAVGREIDSRDFGDFVKSFYPKLFRPEYVPEPFVYAVRRPDHYPDGTISIESASGVDGDGFETVLTSTRKIEGGAAMRMPINSATTIELRGEQYLHAWVLHEFGLFDNSSQAQLVARARQFSSFLLCIGNIAGPTTFQPKHAIIVQNKDEVIIPLLLEQLPTPKAFKDAIRSLSPEQQEFAKAFRSMQLESSVFAVALIQLKPQLENVLDLPDDSLTKEIKLTQNLLELFIDYQIPPDLLSYDGDKTASIGEKLSRVKENVHSVQSMIDEAKEREIKEAERQSDMRGGRKNNNMEGPSVVPSSMDYNLADENVMDMDGIYLMSASIPRTASAQADSMKMRSSASPSAFDASDHHLRATNKAEIDDSSESFGSEDRSNRAGNLGNTVDFSHIVKKLDSAFDEYDVDSALRPTKIIVEDNVGWKKNYQKTLLTPQEKKNLSTEDRKQEKDKAFDLLDALSKSGAQPINYSELHVIVAATHRFDYSLIDTVIRSNENPIVSVERSALIVASTTHDDTPVADLVLGPSRLSSIKEHSPGLLEMGNHPKTNKEAEAAEDVEVTLL